MHGCTLVEVDEQGTARTTPVATDAARWLHERVTLQPATTRAELESLLRERLRVLVETSPKIDLLVSWTIAGDGALRAQLRRENLTGEILASLRSEFGAARPAAWSVALEVEPTGVPAAWYDQETILGDFLRAVRQLEMGPAESLELEAYLGESQQAGAVASVLSLGDKSARQRVLREAARLGADLLSGEEERPS
jgi:DNA repair protein SbcD/Mre11